MGERLSRELRAFEELAHTLASGPYDPDALLERICGEIRAAFGLVRADVVPAGALAAGHPLVARSAAEEQAVTDGRRISVPLLVDGRCLGFVIGDCGGDDADFGEPALQLLTALARVAAVFVDKARAHGRLERSLDERTNFVSLASHELRTPIAVVHGIVSTLHLRGDELAPEQLRELRATAYAQTQRLAALTEQLLDLSRLEAGAVARRSERIRPRRLVEELLARTVPDRSRDVAVEIDDSLLLETDPDALERVLSNLVVNALRYGSPPVRVLVEGSRIVVEDRGRGVPPELVPRLFDRFTRGSNERGGAGLGLAIASSYAQALGGRLSYEQAEPHGARFALVLPRVALTTA